MCLPHLKAGVRIDDKINFANPMCSSGLTELLHLFAMSCVGQGKTKVSIWIWILVLSIVLWGKICMSILRLPEYLCEQDDKEVVTTPHKLCITWCSKVRAVAGFLQVTPVAGLEMTG